MNEIIVLFYVKNVKKFKFMKRNLKRNTALTQINVNC